MKRKKPMEFISFNVVRMGIFDGILGIFGKLLAFIDSLTGNYLLTILLFAVLAKIITFPLSVKQQKSQLKQAKLRPKEMAIRNKYKGRTDQVTQNKMNQEVMDLYQKEGYSPLSGCLPLLVQLPIIFGLYELIRNPLRYICGVSKDGLTAIKEAIVALGSDKLTHLNSSLIKNDNFSGTELDIIGIIQDKSNFDQVMAQVGDKVSLTFDSLPNFSFFGFDLSVVPQSVFSDWSLWIYLIIPVLTFLSMFLSMKITKKLSYQPAQEAANADMGCSMKLMDYMMPLMSTWISFIVPSLLGVYWMFNSILGILQSWILRKMYPAPVFSAADYKAAEREYKGKRIDKNEPDERVVEGKKYVSLHHIDDEDYDENGVYVPKQEEKNDAPKQTKKGFDLGTPELKDDEDGK